ncbi:hypothetical protein D3C78_943270 [compost metagenome]
MAGVTPPLLTRGRYTLVTPFTALPTTLYTCAAIRTMPECQIHGEDVLNDIYIKAGLTKADFDRDSKAGSKIVTLLSDDSVPIYVPDSYIESYPNFDAVPYSHTVLSIDLGALPDFVSLANLQLEISALTSDVVGKESKVTVHRGASTGLVTPEQHEVAEVARVAAIKRRTTYRAENVRLEREKAALLEQNRILMQLLKDNNLM